MSPRSKKAPPTPEEARTKIKTIYDEHAPVKRLRNANEADTRAAVIDSVLAAVGWAAADIRREAASGSGDFLDYELWASSEPWLVIEAKRTGRTFDLSSAGKKRADSRLRSLGTLTSRGGQPLREVLRQAATYSNDRGIPLACATNGYQWLFFRGLSAESRPWNKGSALVFDGPDDILTHFDDFFGALGREAAGSCHLPELLERPRRDIPAPKVPRDYLRLARATVEPEVVALARAVGDALFADIYQHDRRPMLKGCYVAPGIAGDFERSIQRLLKDSERAVDADDDVGRASTEAFVAEIERHEQLSAIEYPVLVVGHVGAGKTTFLHNSLAALRGDIEQQVDPRAFCAIVDLEGHGQGGIVDAAAEEKRVAREILDKLGTAATTVLKKHRRISEGDLNHANPFSPETLKTLQQRKLDEERRLGEKLWEADPTAWSKKEYETLCALRDDPVELLPKFLRQLHNRFKRDDNTRYPTVVVLDNLDQATDDYQRLIYGLARRMAKVTQAILVLCLREDTYAQGREPDGFLSSSHLPFVFHVAAPALDHLLRKRVKYGRAGALPRPINSERDGVGQVCDLVEKTLLPQGSEAVQVVASLAGNNMREALGIVRAFVEGARANTAKPDASASYLLDCLVDSVGQSGLRTRCRMTNCFDADPAEVPLHALPARLLAYFTWAYELGRERTLNEDREVAVGRFAGWGYPTAVVRTTLDELVRDGVLRLAGQGSDGGPRRFSITASGYVHLSKLLELPAYRVAMALVTRWYDEEAADQFIKTADAAGGEMGVTVGDILESSAVSIFDAYLSQMLLREDATLAVGDRDRQWLTDVLGRSSHFVPHPVEDARPPEPVLTEEEDEPEDEQIGLDLPRPDPEPLQMLRRDHAFRGTVWIPRLLWALEWGRRDGRPRLSAADIARVLTEHGDLDVPRNNVARAFRQHKGDPRVEGFWISSGKRYEITDTGALTLKAILADVNGG